MAGATGRDGWKVERDDDSWTVPGYVDLRKLGKGGNGRVVIARHTATSRNVAIKYLNEELCSKTEFRAALRNEARLLSGLTSPHVTRLYEYVEAEQGAAIVMELVYGAALRALLRKEGPTHPEAALVVLKGSLRGLAAAHGVGVVHRDFKPENVLVNWDGQTKLVDFGISARTGDRHNLSGTCAYMPPEQWRTEAATPAGDVYAATATLYECLTGVRPFEGPEPVDFLRQHVEEPVRIDRVPEEVRGLVLHGMAKDPALRPASALDFLRELEWVAENAYGADWEESGQSRLAAVAAALVPSAISRLDARLVGSSAELARTVLTARRRKRLRRRADVLTGAAAVAVAGLLSVMPNGSADGVEAHAGAHTEAVTRVDARKDTGSSNGTRGSEPDRTPEAGADSDGAGAAPADDATGSGSGSGSGSDAGNRGTDARTRAGDTGSGTEKGGGPGDTGTNTDGGTGVENDTHPSPTELNDIDPTVTDSPEDEPPRDVTEEPDNGVPDEHEDPRTGVTDEPRTGPDGSGTGTGSGTGEDPTPRPGHGHANPGTGDGEPGTGNGTGPGDDDNTSPSPSTQSLNSTRQSSTDSGTSVAGSGTGPGSAGTSAVTPRQGAPVAVEGEPG
ncbi:serine/threonine protein kinase [Streptomyces viridochromogenes DSM 40736]|uniref:Serine/threonine protein kinase n=1 Tax=Streptomyces viridochromogenes (strain DSM 40736 / JCM 4977 / BCRC 1201 / Tue 494) TaxID=591159 RepID=D9WZC8_STRVT|nr:serine/threonine-protein kinase [Streptomyces viridochromogenes]EFL35431.1 serine/threonine protein kinase [Streptomyces viridochromogenes DSM 40736]